MQSKKEPSLARPLEQAGDQLAKRIDEASAPERQISSRGRAFLLTYLSFLAATLVLTFFAHQLRLLPGDLTLERDLQAIHYPPFAALMAAISVPGYTLPAALVMLLFVVLFALARRLLEAIFTVLTLAADAVDWAAKLLVNRPRPGADLVAISRAAGDASFPSGHVVRIG